jgi:hypothetical protein
MISYFWAGFGAIIASCTITFLSLMFSEFLWNFLDRYLVRVKMRFVRIIGDNNKQILYEAVNAHAKPITLSSFGLSFKGNKWTKLDLTPTQDNKFPITLGIGNIFNHYSPIEELIITLGRLQKLPVDLHSVWFESSSGKIFRHKIDKWLIRELEEAIYSESWELYNDASSGLLLARGRPKVSDERTGILVR